VQTNIVIFSVKGSGLSSDSFLLKLKEQRVLAVAVDEERVRMVTHVDLTRADVIAAADAVRAVLAN
jgi:threonine aldolase